MSDLFDANIDSVDGWSILLVDASNAFNSLNETTLLYICCCILMFCVLAVLVFFLIVNVVGLCLYFGALLTFCIAGSVLLRVIPYQY